MFRQLDKMKSAGCFGDPGAAAGRSTVAAFPIMSQGKAAIFATASSVLGNIKALAPTLPTAFFATPSVKAKDTTPTYAFNTSVVTSRNNVAATKKYIAWLARPGNQLGFSRIQSSVSLHQMTTGKGLSPQMKAVAPALRKGNIHPFAFNSSPNPNMLAWAGKAGQNWLNGRTSGAEILRGMDYMWDNPTATQPPS
jgi:ABC-type glycerol-3-phosphate transport system substrate-binding protein